MTKFVLASNNAKKLAELRDILAELGVSVVSLAEAGIFSEPEETGTTFEANALIKARSAMEASGLPAIADDSGIWVDALGGEPGVYSARYGGEGFDDEGRTALLIRNLGDEKRRAARFECAVACVFPDGREITVHGQCAGEVTASPRGAGGFGYDPVFLVEGMGRTMAELEPGEKNAISHRARALTKLKEELSGYVEQ